MIATGPTAHLPPVFPFIVSLIYRFFGLTSTAGFAVGLMIVLFGSFLYGLLPWFSERFGLGRQAGFIGGIAGGLKVGWPGHGEFLTGLLLGLILVIFLKRWTRSNISWEQLFFFGIFIGITFHVQPALLPVVLGCILFELWWRKDGQRIFSVVVITLGIFIACVPWAWRNTSTFDGFFFIRSNFGLELRMGNHEGAVATMEEMDAMGEHRHPRTHFAEVKKLREVGELAYMRQAQEEAFDWIRSNPDEFLWLAVQRFANVWFGPWHRPEDAIPVALMTLLAVVGFWWNYSRLRTPQRAALLIPIITYPAIYYFLAYMPRYRIPVDWLLYLLAGALVWRVLDMNPPDRHGKLERNDN